MQACISVLYGQSSNAVNNRVLGQFDMAVIPSQAGVPQIEVTCSLDAGLRLTVVARDVDSGRQKVWQQGSSAA